jgi:hypothetical protein
MRKKQGKQNLFVSFFFGTDKWVEKILPGNDAATAAADDDSGAGAEDEDGFSNELGDQSQGRRCGRSGRRCLPFCTQENPSVFLFFLSCINGRSITTIDGGLSTCSSLFVLSVFLLAHYGILL